MSSGEAGRVRSGSKVRSGQVSSGLVRLIRLGHVDQVRSGQSLRVGQVNQIDQFRSGEFDQFRSV